MTLQPQYYYWLVPIVKLLGVWQYNLMMTTQAQLDIVVPMYHRVVFINQRLTFYGMDYYCNPAPEAHINAIN